MTDKKINFKDFEIVTFLKRKIIDCIKNDYYCSARDYSSILSILRALYDIRDNIKYIPKDTYIFCKKELRENIYLLDSFINKLNLKIA